MKALPEEQAVEKIFEALHAVSDLRTPDIMNINFTDSANAYGTCSQQGQVNICFNQELNLNNPRFVETVVHEIIHYNYWEWAHNAQFQEWCTKLTKRVLMYLEEHCDRNLQEMQQRS